MGKRASSGPHKQTDRAGGGFDRQGTCSSTAISDWAKNITAIEGVSDPYADDFGSFAQADP